MKRIVIGFDTTTNAMALEICAKKYNIPGKLIPIPNEMSAGCGLAWKTDSSNEEEVLSYLKKYNLHWEKLALVNFKE